MIQEKEGWERKKEKGKISQQSMNPGREKITNDDCNETNDDCNVTNDDDCNEIVICTLFEANCVPSFHYLPIPIQSLSHKDSFNSLPFHLDFSLPFHLDSSLPLSLSPSLEENAV